MQLKSRFFRTGALRLYLSFGWACTPAAIATGDLVCIYRVGRLTICSRETTLCEVSAARPLHPAPAAAPQPQGSRQSMHLSAQQVHIAHCGSSKMLARAVAAAARPQRLRLAHGSRLRVMGSSAPEAEALRLVG